MKMRILNNGESDDSSDLLQGKKSFLLHKDSFDMIADLTDEEAGKLLKAMYSHQTNRSLASVDRITKLLLSPFVAQFKRDDEKWLSIRQRNVSNGKKGGRPRNPVGSLGTQNNPEEPKKAVSVSVSVSAKEKENIKEKPIAGAKAPVKRFSPPSVEEIAQYAKEKGYAPFDSEYFFNFYEMKNWMVGRNKMKNWKSAVSNAKDWDAHFRTKPNSSNAPKTTYLFEE